MKLNYQGILIKMTDKLKILLNIQRDYNQTPSIDFPEEHLGVADKFLLNWAVRENFFYLGCPKVMTFRLCGEIIESMRAFGYKFKPVDWEC